MQNLLAWFRAPLNRCFGFALIPAILVTSGLQDAPDKKPLNEAIQPPVSSYAQPDVVDKGEFRPILEVSADGTITAGRDTLFDPQSPDDYGRLREWLKAVRQRMHLEKVPLADGESLELPAEKLLIRADLAAPFRCSQKIMENCGRNEIAIWKVQFAVSPKPDAAAAPEGAKTVAEGRIDAYLPNGCEPAEKEEQESFEVVLSVIEPGTKVRREDGKPWDGDSSTPWSYGSDRVVEYLIGMRRTRSLSELEKYVTTLLARDESRPGLIDARQQTTFGDVVLVLDVLRKAGCERVGYVGSYE